MLTVLRRVLPIVILACGLASCGQQSSFTPLPPQPPATTLLPRLDTLTNAANGDVARGTSSVSQTLDLSQGNYINSSFTGGSVQLNSSSSKNAATYFGYFLTYGGQRVPYLAPYDLTVTTTGGECWVALADYKSGRWRSLPAPLTAGTNTVPVTLEADAAAADGVCWFAFISTRGQAVDVTNVTLSYPDAPIAGAPVEYQQFIKAQDGTRLATSVYLPFQEASPFIPDPPYPAVLIRTPYDKLQIDPTQVATATSANVAVLIQYFRGRFGDTGSWPDSDGTEGLFDDHAGPAHTDALDTVSWLEARTFYNGDLATTGPSALGLANYQAVPALGSRVKGFFNQISCANVADWVMLENGCFGKYNVETFLSANGYPATLLPFVENKFATHDTPFFNSYDFNTQASNVAAPGFHETGWWDLDVNETIKTWSAFNTNGATGGAGAQWLVIGPWTHDGIRTNAAGGMLFPTTGDIHDPTVIPAGWDGIQFLLFSLGRNPFFTPPANRVLYYMVGPFNDTTGVNNSWLEAASWPPPSLPTSMYLDNGGVLTDIPPVVPSTGTFASDPANPVPTVGGRLLPFGPEFQGPLDQLNVFLDPPSFNYFETSPLVADVTVAGDIVISLRVEIDGSVTQPADTDIAVRLIDDDTLGAQLLIADSIVRLSDALGTAPAVNTPYNITFSLGPRAYNFGAGHKLGVHVSGSNSPQYAVNPGNGDAFYDGSNGVVQNIKLHLGDVGGQCQLLLPIRVP